MFEKFGDRTRAALFMETGLHIAGNRELVLENCRRIEECSDIFMRILSGGLFVHVWGSDLRAFDYKTGGLVIRGKIDKIELEERRSVHASSDKRQR